MIRAVPIYDYRCDACGHAFSAVQSYQDATLEICPQCGARPRKLMVSPAIVFKGSGWYKTDSRRGSSDAKADAKADGRDTKDGQDGKADGKDAKAEGKDAKADGKDAKADGTGVKEGKGGKAETTESKPAAAAEKSKPAEAKKEPSS